MCNQHAKLFSKLLYSTCFSFLFSLKYPTKINELNNELPKAMNFSNFHAGAFLKMHIQEDPWHQKQHVKQAETE